MSSKPANGPPITLNIAVIARNREITRPAFDVYVPFAQSPDRIETFVVRTVGASDAAVPTIRERLQTLSGGALVSIEAMADVVSAHEAPWRANLALFAAYAGLHKRANLRAACAVAYARRKH